MFCCRRLGDLAENVADSRHLLQRVVVEEAQPGEAAVALQLHHPGEAEGVEMPGTADDSPRDEPGCQLGGGQASHRHTEGWGPAGNLGSLGDPVNCQAGDPGRLVEEQGGKSVLVLPDQLVGDLQPPPQTVLPPGQPPSHPQGGEVLHGRLDAGDGFEAGGARLPPGGLVGARAGEEVTAGGQLVGAEGVEQVLPPVQEAGVRSAELVGAADQEVAGQLLHVHQSVRSVVDPVNINHSTALAASFYRSHCLLDVGDGTAGVGCTTNSGYLREGGKIERDFMG